ncbi:hypothetical protein [uncultured Microscilla sp.]|uniref:hypothetical protein n=1 Tax=uncultured Microscilla sp. TaxID=432653 RepID=UPI0026112F0A|nr:hypothetical protein [uncultured Microscilla sp.]
MKLFPRQSSVFVSGYTIDEIAHKLEAAIKPAKVKEDAFSEHWLLPARSLEQDYPFRGVIQEAGFRISRKVTYPESFMPVIDGKIESTSKGCILFIDYTLLKGTRFFMSVALVFSLILGMLLLFAEHNLWYLLASLGFVGLGYAVAWLNFQQKVKICKDLLEEVLEKEV